MKSIIFIFTLFILATSHCGWGQKLTIQKDGVLFMDNKGKIVLHNSDWINNGESILNGDSSDLIFSGKNDNVIGGHRTTGIARMKMLKSDGGQLNLEQSIFIDNSIEFVNGILNIKNRHITLDSDAQLLNENDQSRIFTTDSGTISISITPVKDHNTNPGNLGFEFTSSQNPGIVTVIRGHKPPIVQPDGTGIHRFYEIHSDYKGRFDTVRFHYLPAELNGSRESEIEILIRHPNSGWELSEKKDHNINQHYIEISGVDSVYQWTAASELNALPVVFEEITTTCRNNELQLSFTTGVEYNIDYYKIMKSGDGWNWEPTGIVTPVQNVSKRNYNFTDKTPQKFYRIEAREKDETITYSSIQQARCSANDPFISVFPNPFREYINLQVKSKINSAIKIKIYDSDGKSVYTTDLSDSSNYKQQTIYLPPLAPGAYTLSIIHPTGETIRNINLIKH